MIDVAVIGCGGIGKIHARAYQKIPGVRVAYMIDRIEALAQAAAAEFGAEALTDHRLMKLPVQAVSVVTPPDAHYDIIMDLLDSGIPVFTEKPLAMRVDEVEAIAAKCAATGVPLGIGFKMRREPVFAQARELIGRLGPIYAVSAVKTQPYNPRPNGWVPRVGCMYELSVHEYDLVNWIAGLEPQTVRAELAHSLGWAAEDRAYLDIDYTGGVKGQLMSLYTTGQRFTFRDLTISYIGENGYLKIERPNRLILHTTEDEVIDVTPRDNVDIFAEQLQEFLACVQSGRPFEPGPRAGAGITRLIEAARQSAATNQRVLV